MNVQMIEQIAALNIRDYGPGSRALGEILSEAKKQAESESAETGVAAALNNGDIDGVLLRILETPEAVLKGMNLTAHAMGTGNQVLFVPDQAEDELVERLKDACAEYGVRLERGIVDVRAYQNWALVHIVTMEALYERANGAEADGVYISLDGRTLKKERPDVLLSDLLENPSEVKGFLSGYEFFGPSAAGRTLGELKIENGLFRPIGPRDCIVRETEKRLMKFCVQSCGKCVFCREGLLQLQQIQKDIMEGRGKKEQLELTGEIAGAMPVSTPCTLGQNASRIALSALELFAGEIEEHVKKKNCPAGQCKSFVNYYIDPMLCTGCGDCADACEADCIEGKSGFIHMIDAFDCTKCGKCAQVCGDEAVKLASGKLPKLPAKLTKVGKFKKR